MHLYKRVCPSVCLSVRGSVCLSGPRFFQWADYGRKWSEMNRKTVLMLHTSRKVFWIDPKCFQMSQNVPKCPLQTHRCPNGLVEYQFGEDFARAWIKSMVFSLLLISNLIFFPPFNFPQKMTLRSKNFRCLRYHLRWRHTHLGPSHWRRGETGVTLTNQISCHQHGGGNRQTPGTTTRTRIRCR